MPPTAPPRLPDVQGRKFCDMALPTCGEAWPLAPDISNVPEALGASVGGTPYDAPLAELRAGVGHHAFEWPGRTMYFFSDIHADADAWRRSLIASGGVRWHGPGDAAFELSPEGSRALFVIAGDCLDKGPDNLRLLRAIKVLIDKGADVEILAGNHDLRTLVGLAYMGRKEPRFAHLFVRMGKKTMPLFQEIRAQYVREGQGCDLSEDELRALLFPGPRWFEGFPAEAAGLVPDKKIKKELTRIREKMVELPQKCAILGLTLGDIYVAAETARALFLEPGGEFHWFFERMVVARRWGSFLLVHAGVDDVTAKIAALEGVDGLNRRFHALLAEDPFALYHGPIGNMFRTKYREIDAPFSARGLAHMHQAGLFAVVHGHRNILRGHRVLLREGLLDFECDCSVDINTRKLEGLSGLGGATLIFRPEGVAIAISADHPQAKVFDASRVFSNLHTDA